MLLRHLALGLGPSLESSTDPLGFTGSSATRCHPVPPECPQAPYNADDIGVLDIASEAFHAVDISSTISIDTKHLGVLRVYPVVSALHGIAHIKV